MPVRWIPFLLLVGCAPQLTPAEHLERQICLAEVEAAWHRKADRLCPPEHVFHDECAYASALEEELERKMRACTPEASR